VSKGREGKREWNGQGKEWEKGEWTGRGRDLAPPQKKNFWRRHCATDCTDKVSARKLSCTVNTTVYLISHAVALCALHLLTSLSSASYLSGHVCWPLLLQHYESKKQDTKLFP